MNEFGEEPDNQQEQTQENQQEQQHVGEYYAMLNVDSHATTEEIRAAYRRLSMLYHPDRHLGENEREAAQKQFVKITQAYEVLSNPQLREIYDVAGASALDLNSQTIDPNSQQLVRLSSLARAHSPQALKARINYAIAMKEEQRLRDSMRPKGTITLGLDCSEFTSSVFDATSSFLSSSSHSTEIETPDINRVEIQQSLDVLLFSFLFFSFFIF